MTLKTESYTLTSGEVIEYPSPGAAIADYLAQVRQAAQDPTVTLGELVDLIYAEANPLLKTGIIPGRGAVTREVFDDPIYHVMIDQIAIKRIQTGTLDPEHAKLLFTMSVSEAAQKLGVSTSAVRQAIYTKRLAAQKVDGQWKLDPAAVDAYQVSNRGPTSPLEVVMGSATGISFSVLADVDLERDARGADGEVIGRFRGWSRAGVKMVRNGDNSAAFWELAPAGAETELSVDQFSARGRFEVARKVVGKKEAAEAFKEFRARLDKSAGA